jgi:hypothetical protein
MNGPRISLRSSLQAFPVILLSLALGACSRQANRTADGKEGSDPHVDQMLSRLMAIEAKEKEVAETVWAEELIAQRAGQVFERFWDLFNASIDRWELAAAFTSDSWLLPQFATPVRVAHGIQLCEPVRHVRLSAAEWPTYLRSFEQAGWRPVQLEFRHNRCEVTEGRPVRSQLHFEVHLEQPAGEQRAALAGNLDVTWAVGLKADGFPAVREVDASQLSLKTLQGPVPFAPVLEEIVRPPEKSQFIDPLILHDLDGDGLSEIILAARNLVFRRRAWNRFEREPLCRHPIGLIFTGVIADFSGDGQDDFLCAKFEGLSLFRGSTNGVFEEPERRVWSVEPHLKYAQVLTCGDVDSDGDLDIWLGQYKGPYVRGQMPTPYFDANDGNPAYLLLNDGSGKFTDATEVAGLAEKRWRRSYSGSLIDLDKDEDLDLLVVSDFAGVDVYANDGNGLFTDLTAQWLPERHVFGMAHAFADFNADGDLDFLVTGMHCPTPQRLEALGLVRPERPDYAVMRARMTRGNRLFLRDVSGYFGSSALSDSIAHSGWSWGCTAFDFDNDSYPDVYIGNGHESKQSVQDYEPEFWLHDIYVGSSQHDEVVWAYFGSKQGRTRGQGMSYGGYEKNRLFWNQSGSRFLEVGHLLGVALESDSRAVAADDLDGDGREDLLVTTTEVWPTVRQTLRVYHNRVENTGNWLAVRLSPRGIGVSSVGAVVTVSAGGRRLIQAVATGDSHRAQRANRLHFGLGPIEEVDRLEVRWPNGTSSILAAPGINECHTVEAPH